MLRFFFNGQAVTLLVKFRHSVTFRITHPVAEYRSFLFFLSGTYRFAQHGAETIPMKNVVT